MQTPIKIHTSSKNVTLTTESLLYMIALFKSLTRNNNSPFIKRRNSAVKAVIQKMILLKDTQTGLLNIQPSTLYDSLAGWEGPQL